MNVRASRREIVRDLERLFQFAKVDGRPLILPSFELVKYKYDPEANPDRAAMGTDPNAFRFYAFPVAMYVTLAFLCIRLAIIPTAMGADGQLSSYLINPAGTLQRIDYLRLLWRLYLDHAILDQAHRQLRPVADLVLPVLPAYFDGDLCRRRGLALPSAGKHRHQR